MKSLKDSLFNISSDNQNNNNNNNNNNPPIIKKNKFKINPLPSNRDDLVYLNVIYHNKNDFDGKNELYLKINNFCIYKSIHRNDVEKECLEMNAIMRRLFKITITNQFVELVEIKYVSPNIINKLKINIYLKSDNDNIVSIHEEEINEFIKEYFKNYIFFSNQNLIFKYKDYILVIEVDLCTGMMTDETKIEINSDDVNLNIIGSKLLKRDLFRSDYNFENIGIGGLDKKLIEIFKGALCTRAFNQSTIDKMGILHVKGILLYGPPGTGKTLIARKIGGMISNIKPKIINGPEVLNAYIGKSEENIRQIFKDAINDTNNENLHVIIFDEIDAICKKRGKDGAGANVNDNMVNQLLSLIDGYHALNNIFIIAMTNRKELLDPALLRAGRIEIALNISLPNIEGRKQIFRIHTEKMKKSKMMDEIDLDKLAKSTENFSGAEIESVVKRASSNSLHEIISSDKENINDNDIVVKMRHFEKAVDSMQPMFGNNNKKLETLLPENYNSNISEKYITNLNYILEIFKKKYNFTKILVTGGSGNYKSTLLIDSALKANIKYTKLIRAIDVIYMDEISKVNYVSDIIMESHNSNDSLVIIDDIEILINYANILNSISFSNRLYQMLLTILKSSPDNKKNRMTLMVTCGNEDLANIIKDYFNDSVVL